MGVKEFFKKKADEYGESRRESRDFERETRAQEKAIARQAMREERIKFAREKQKILAQERIKRFKEAQNRPPQQYSQARPSITSGIQGGGVLGALTAQNQPEVKYVKVKRKKPKKKKKSNYYYAKKKVVSKPKGYDILGF